MKRCLLSLVRRVIHWNRKRRHHSVAVAKHVDLSRPVGAAVDFGAGGHRKRHRARCVWRGQNENRCPAVLRREGHAPQGHREGGERSQAGEVDDKASKNTAACRSHRQPWNVAQLRRQHQQALQGNS